MITDYYCKRCDAGFSESKLPNLNMTHACGELARVIHFADDTPRIVAEESHAH